MGEEFMNILFTTLIIVLLLTALFDMLLLLTWLKGISTLILPGLGIAIAIPALILLTSLLHIVITFLAIVVDRYRGDSIFA